MSLVNGRTSDLPLRIIVFAEHTDANLGVVREMLRDGVSIFLRSTPMSGEDDDTKRKIGSSPIH